MKVAVYLAAPKLCVDPYIATQQMQATWLKDTGNAKQTLKAPNSKKQIIESLCRVKQKKPDKAENH